MTWSKANHFKLWASEQEARSSLPLLLRKLIRAFVPSDSLVNLPALEQVQRPGFDGIVETSSGSQFVPEGRSVWEMGVDTNPKSKADGDYKKRTKETPIELRQQCTFVFVTPREWRIKDEWSKKKCETGEWSNVMAFDCNDLEHWIELCPAVDVWFAILNGRRPEGIEDLQQRWEGLRQIASHGLTPDVFLCDREPTISGLVEWFQQPPASLLMRSDSFEDGLDFLAALTEQETENLRFDSIIAVNTLSSWTLLASNREPITLVATGQLALSASDISQAINNGHHVLIVAGRTASKQASEIELRRQQVYKLKDSLQECGFDDATANSKARAAVGSSSILKRLLTSHPQTAFPGWAHDGYRQKLCGFALIGGWRNVDPNPPARENDFLPSNTKIDLICLEDFTGLQRDQIEQTVSRWSECDQPLFLRFGNAVVVTSREDAWFLLGGSITPNQLSRFESLAMLVLDEDNPAFEMESKDRWMANIYGKTHSLSHELRNGIIESLALMCCYPTSQTPDPQISFQVTATKILNRVLPPNAPWERWATFDHQLITIAEVNAEFLMKRIEDDLATDDPQVPKLFEGQQDPLFGGSNHCGLLWALETIAWNPKYLSRVTALLGHLARLEGCIRENYSNRPSNSLKEIFNWWLPHTNASIDERISALSKLLDTTDEIGWNLLTRLMPGGHETVSMPTQQPRWRDWAVGWTREKVSKTTHLYAKRLAELVLERAEKCPRKWSAILDGIFRYDRDTTVAAIERLEEIAIESNDQDGKSDLWLELDSMIRRHEAYADADWSFPEDVLTRLKRIADKLEPDNPVLINEWLFGHDARFARVDILDDYEEYQRVLKERRISALNTIVEEIGVDGLLELVRRCGDCSSVGWLSGLERLMEFSDIDYAIIIASGSDGELHFLHSYIGGRFHVDGVEFLAGLPLDSMDHDQAAFVLCALPFTRNTWDWMEQNCSAEQCTAYWKRSRGFVRKSQEDVQYAVAKLLEVERPFQAADTLHMASTKPDSLDLEVETVFQVLETALTVPLSSTDRVPTYTLQELIKFLQESENVPQDRLARIEWGYLKILDRHTSQVRPTTLFRVVVENPNFFIDLLKAVYRAESERGEAHEPPTEMEQVMYRNAHDLLDALVEIPGVDNEGNVDAETLSKWVKAARDLGEAADRKDITDSHIGKLLSRYPRSDSLDWPPDEICGVMESIDSDRMLRGFQLGISNSRGIVSRDPFEGGAKERDLAVKYRKRAELKRDKFPKVANVFESLARDYERQAIAEDEDAARSRLDR